MDTDDVDQIRHMQIHEQQSQLFEPTGGITPAGHRKGPFSELVWLNASNILVLEHLFTLSWRNSIPMCDVDT